MFSLFLDGPITGPFGGRGLISGGGGRTSRMTVLFIKTEKKT